MVFFKDAIDHICRAARIFRQPGGHMLLVCWSFDLPRGKTNNVVSEQVRHKSGCTVRENAEV